MEQIPGRKRFNAADIADDDLMTLITHLKKVLERPYVQTIFIQNPPHKDLELTRGQARDMLAALRVRYYEIMN